MKIWMKRYLTLLGCSLLFLGSAAVGQEAPAGDATQAQRQAAGELPDNPTRAQCEAFVKEIRRQSMARDGIRATDPQIEKLSQLPVEHIDLLVREMQFGGNPSQMLTGGNQILYHANMAVGTYDPESYRKLAIEGLSKEPAFIYLIARHGWYQQAKPAILAKLKAVDPKDAKFAPIWWQAFIEVVEPEHHPLLHEIALGFYDLDNRLQLLETLPGYDFAKTVKACWEKAKQPDENGKEKTAVVLAFMRNGKVKVTDTLRPYAIRAGQIDAFDPLIEQLNPNRKLVTRIGQNLPARALSARLTLRRHLDFNGTNEEIQTWFRTHRDQLVFNPFTQRFELPED